jgi:DNA-binding transcriptional LysR family regulator
LAEAAAVTLQDLNDIELIVSEESCIYRGIFEKLLKDHGIQFRIGFELGSLEVIKQCVTNGLGVALLPQIAAQEEVRRGSVAIIPFTHESLRFELQIMVHPKKWMSQPLLTFINMLTGEERLQLTGLAGTQVD